MLVYIPYILIVQWLYMRKVCSTSMQDKVPTATYCQKHLHSVWSAMYAPYYNSSYNVKCHIEYVNCKAEIWRPYDWFCFDKSLSLVKWVEFVYICLRNKTRPTLFIGETILLTDHTHETIINHKQKGNIHMWLHCVQEYTRPFTSKASWWTCSSHCLSAWPDKIKLC